ncbi:MAG: DNA polymerase IV [Pseudomonadota bacterium]
MVTLPTLCRDCLALETQQALDTCAACGSGNLVSHPELLELTLAHLDCDAFYAAVEKRDNPELEGKPVIVGGGARGVVTTACYIARINGVRSAMPMFKAKRLCPQAVIIKPRMARYREVSQRIRRLMLDVTPQIEPISVDEAFLDLAGTQRLHKAAPAQTMLALAKRIERDIGITVSIGLSYNKYLAKVASDYRKPRGFHVIGRADALEFLAPQPVSLLFGVGKVFARKLERDGISKIGQIQAMSSSALMARYGSMGSHIWSLATGQDSRAATPQRAAKSISSERTFNTDINALGTLSDVLWTLCEDVSRSLSSTAMTARTVQLKLKTADFRTITRRHTPGGPLTAPRQLFEPAQQLLERCADGTDFRLLGVGVAGLAPAQEAPHEAGLFAPKAQEKDAQLNEALSAIRGRFGINAIETGRTNRARVKGLRNRQSVSKSQTEDDPDERA